MKRILVLLFVCCFLSCSDDDNGFDIELNGTWTLTNVSCFCGFPDPPGFENTQVTFVDVTNEVIVLNEESEVYFRENGVYSYTGSENTIVLEDGRAYNFEINEDVLLLVFVDEPNIADDEISYTFRKNADL